MKIAVMGAGAVGSYVGGMLAKAGHKVVLIGRKGPVAAISKNGLRIDTVGATVQVAIKATTDPAATADADIVLFCVKSDATRSAARDIAPYLSPLTAIFSFQNGVGNTETLTEITGRETAAAVVYLAAKLKADGHVACLGGNKILLGDAKAAPELAAALVSSGFDASVAPNIDSAIWGKLIVNCAYNALSAIPYLPYGQMMKVDGAADLMTGIVDECISVADGLGICLPADIHNTVKAIAIDMPQQYSSMAQDLSRQRKTEIDYLNSVIVSKGARLGIPTPYNQTLVTLIKLLEEKTVSQL